MTSCSHQGHACATCGDKADTVTVVSLDGPDASVTLESGETARIAVDLIPGVAEGDRLLVHQGVAIGRADRESNQ